MKSLIPLSDPKYAALASIFVSKNGSRRQRLTKLRGRIEASCDNYKRNTTALHSIVPIGLGPLHRRDLVHCYEVSTAALDALKAAIVKHLDQKLESTCPYCRITPSIKSFDHYLPKETFHEFSIFSENMVPCCTECNNLKGTKWLKGVSRRLLSVYFDSMPSGTFLATTVTAAGGAFSAKYELKSDPLAYGVNEALVRSHFEELNLLERYKDASIKMLAEDRRAILIQARRVSPGYARDFCTVWADELLAQDPNYWRGHLLKAAALCPEYCEP